MSIPIQIGFTQKKNKMLPLSKLINSIFIFFYFTFTICSAINHNNTSIEEFPMKMHLVEEIIRKVCNISLHTLSKKKSVEKDLLLLKIEEKLIQSSRALGMHGTKYINNIMRVVKSKAYENYQVENAGQTAENKKAAKNKPILRSSSLSLPNIDPEFDFKDSLVQNIANKIELLARNYVSNAKNQEERDKMMANIKKTFIKSADRKQALMSYEYDKDELKHYVDLVTKGIELVMKRDTFNLRRWDFVYTDNININKDSEDRIGIDPIKTDSVHSSALRQGSNYSKPKSVLIRVSNETKLSPNYTCENMLEESCSKIKFLKTLRCISDNREFSILKLCDGVGDCLDFSDEIQCGQQAIETLQKSYQLLAYIDTSINAFHCFSDKLQKKVLSKQNKVLNEVLKNQLTFLERHTLKQTDVFSRRVYNADKDAVMETVNEAVNVVDSLTTALGSSICANFDKHGERETRLDKIDLEELEKGIRLASQTPDQEYCKCNGQTCIQKCSSICERICFNMHSLSQIACEAVTGNGLVSIDMLCDGKLDCYDELDEKDCAGEDVSLTKFEATQMYNLILKNIKFKMATTTSEAVRSRLQSLYALVTKLEILSLKRNVDVLEVKRVRQACFAELPKVYDAALLHLKKEHERDDLRFFLIAQNERLISALKRTHTGNDKIISTDGCMCRDSRCILPRCSKPCIRACSVEPKLTRFFCGELSEQNYSVPLELVCNGKANCPNEEDEKDCRKEVCRMLHLKVLRHKLQDVGKKQAGTALGEALRSWRVKVTATLLVAENNERPSPVVLYDILHDLLHDLVMAYAALEERKDNAPIFKEFYDCSRVVIDILKSCSQ